MSNAMFPFDSKQVFSSLVQNYIKYRPGYPTEVRDVLIDECGLSPGWRVADIGSGTGLLTCLFLDFGCALTGIEPNEEMRRAGEQLLAGYSRFTSLSGSAETTGLADESIDLVTAGMAFHWFDIPRARQEFIRVLAPDGWVALVWHRMLTGPETFMQNYTSLVLEYSPGWSETQRREHSLDLQGFFGGVYHRRAFPFFQILDWDGLCGRTLSIAHVPGLDDPAHQPMFSRLQDIFERHQNNGEVVLQYETEIYYRRLI